MNQEWVTVSQTEQGGIWVESLQRSACDTCNAQAGCGQRTLSQLGKPIRLWVESDEHFTVGQEVLVELPTGGLAASALLMYGIPLLALLIAALLGQLLENDVIATIIGFSGLVMGLLISRRLSQRYKQWWQPKVLPSCIKTVSVDQ